MNYFGDLNFKPKSNLVKVNILEFFSDHVKKLKSDIWKRFLIKLISEIGIDSRFN